MSRTLHFYKVQEFFSGEMHFFKWEVDNLQTKHNQIYQQKLMLPLIVCHLWYKKTFSSIQNGTKVIR